MIDDKGQDMQDFIMQMDREMSKKSFQYFFTEILKFDLNWHHE